MKQSGRSWFDVRRLSRDKFATPLTITFAFVASHNHFVLDRGGNVFNRSAPIIKLPATSTEEDHLALLAWLNSSAACFWMKQVSHDKGSGTDSGKWQAEPAKIAFEFTGTALERAPVPSLGTADRERAIELARSINELAALRSRVCSSILDATLKTTSDLRSAIQRSAAEHERLGNMQILKQEELDWHYYHALSLCDGLTSNGAPGDRAPVPLGFRPFEMMLARNGQTTGIDGQPLSIDLPVDWPEAQRQLWNRRIRAIASSPALQTIEVPDYKRRWRNTPKDLGGRVWTFDDEVRQFLDRWLRGRIEAVVREFDARPTSVGEIAASLASDDQFSIVAEYLSGQEGFEIESFCRDLLASDSIPYLAALRHTDEGLAKRARWEHTWDLQRREDLGESVGEIPVPPKYDREDYRDPRYWSLRGKLDVPRERFIAYPGAETDPKAPLFGWAGWDHLQRAKALASVYQQRKTLDGWDAPRLLPLLAGLRELLFWITLWHDAPDPDLDGARAGQVWAEFLEGERAYVGCSEDDLRAWRPAAKVRKGRGKG
jgi:hypothetical protein